MKKLLTLLLALTLALLPVLSLAEETAAAVTPLSARPGLWLRTLKTGW